MAKEEPGQLKHALIDSMAGALAGAISRTVTSPLDVIKIRFQVQLEPTSSWTLLQRDLYWPSKYTGILQATKDIFREEGLRGFWRGNVPALLMYMPYSAIQFTVMRKLKTLAAGSSKAGEAAKFLKAILTNRFDFSCKLGLTISFTHLKVRPHACILEDVETCLSIKLRLGNLNLQRPSSWSPVVSGCPVSIDYALQLGWDCKEDHLQLSPYLSYVSGALSGCAATVGSYPFDLLRTILASQGEPKVYTTMRSAFVDIIKTRGIRGLYAGLSPTLVEIIPYAGLQFGTYDTFKRWMMMWNRYQYPHVSGIRQDDSISSFQLFLCGFAAGTCAKAICHPLDVVKKRFQIEGLPRHPRYGARIENQTYKGMYDALRQIVKMEGWGGLYKGIVPSLVKSAPAGAVTFLAYEWSSDWLESILT